MAYVFLPTVVANIFFLTGTAYNILPFSFPDKGELNLFSKCGSNVSCLTNFFFLLEVFNLALPLLQPTSDF